MGDKTLDQAAEKILAIFRSREDHLRTRLEEVEMALRDITDNVIIIHLDANGDHRYALNHRAHRAITRANGILTRKGGRS